MPANKYSFHLAWSEEDEAYIANCPEFPGLLAHGGTPEEAIAEAQIALEGVIAVYEDSGMELPEPQTRQEYSGQFRVRIPKTLHRQAAEMAAQEHVSLNAFVATAIAARVGAQSAQQPSGQITTPVQITVNSVINVTAGATSGGVIRLKPNDLAGANQATTAVEPSNDLVN
jgi:predicted RNase H-like HicB family nuclease